MSYFKDLIAKADTAKMADITEILDVHFTELEQEDNEMYMEVMSEIYETVVGVYFDLESATYAVSCMENEDGTVGEHWTVEETDSVAKAEGITSNLYDWYYVLNMIYSDYSAIIGSDTATYIKLAKAWIMDKDAPEGKPYLYWKMIRG